MGRWLGEWSGKSREKYLLFLRIGTLQITIRQQIKVNKKSLPLGSDQRWTLIISIACLCFKNTIRFFFIIFFLTKVNSLKSIFIFKQWRMYIGKILEFPLFEQICFAKVLIETWNVEFIYYVIFGWKRIYDTAIERKVLKRNILPYWQISPNRYKERKNENHINFHK